MSQGDQIAYLLVGSFFLVLAGTLIVDLVEFWPNQEAHPQTVHHTSDE
jgi:hypothetical protein